MELIPPVTQTPVRGPPEMMVLDHQNLGCLPTMVMVLIPPVDQTPAQGPPELVNDGAGTPESGLPTHHAYGPYTSSGPDSCTRTSRTDK